MQILYFHVSTFKLIFSWKLVTGWQGLFIFLIAMFKVFSIKHSGYTAIVMKVLQCKPYIEECCKFSLSYSSCHIGLKAVFILYRRSDISPSTSVFVRLLGTFLGFLFIFNGNNSFLLEKMSHFYTRAWDKLCFPFHFRWVSWNTSCINSAGSWGKILWRFLQVCFPPNSVHLLSHSATWCTLLCISL